MAPSKSFHLDDHQALRRQARFLEEVEMAIRASNQEIIGAALPDLDRAAFVRMAVAVAKQRALYLKAVMATNWNDPTDTAFRDLQRHRETYEEARAGFEALRHAIERGYTRLKELPPETTP